MEKDEKYQTYATSPAKEIPISELNYLINSCMLEASLNMGNSFDERDLNRVIYFINTDFNFLPVCYIWSAFLRGSLGKFGAGRLIPRTVYSWLNEVTNEFKQLQEHKAIEEHFKVKNTGFDLHKYPVGKAICKKVDWYNAGLLDGDDWDRVNLKELAEAIAKNENITFEKFFK